jgi:hypothetical protein
MASTDQCNTTLSIQLGHLHQSEFDLVPKTVEETYRTDSRAIPFPRDYMSVHSSPFYKNHSPGGDSGLSDGSSRNEDETSKNSQPALLRLPELVDVLAKQGQVLRWDDDHNWYEVLDGPLFEERFNELRCTREKRKEQAADRPFAR